MHVGIAVHCYLVFVNERTRCILLTFDVNLYFSHCFNKVLYTPEYQNEFNTLASTNVAELVPPEIRHRNRQTDTNRDLDYTYIWAKDWAEWTLGKPRSPSRIVCCLVRNSVLALGSNKKISTRSIHVGSLSKVSRHFKLHIPISIVTILYILLSFDSIAHLFVKSPILIIGMLL